MLVYITNITAGPVCYSHKLVLLDLTQADTEMGSQSVARGAPAVPGRLPD